MKLRVAGGHGERGRRRRNTSIVGILGKEIVKGFYRWEG